MIDPRVHNVGKGIHKDIQYPGKGPLPKYQKDTKALFHFRTYINNDERTLIDDSRAWDEPFELLFGHSFQLESWENGVKSMRPGERSMFYCVPEKCLGYTKLSKTLRDMHKKKKDKDAIVTKSCCGNQSTGYCDLDKLTGQSLIFEFDLLSVEQPGEYSKQIWTMTSDEKRLLVIELKEKGNNEFKAKNYDAAEQNYAKAIGTLEQLGLKEQPNSEEWNIIEDMKVPLLLNYSQVMICKEEYATAITHLNTVLKREPKNIKGLYRRATAHGGCWNIKEAREDWDLLAQVDPSQKSLVTRKLQELETRVKQKEAEDRKKLHGMF